MAIMYHRGVRRTLMDQSSGTGTPRPNIKAPILSKRVCFYKSGDPQFSGLRMVINNRTFKTFDALLDSLSQKVALPFGVRNITTPQGVHAVYSLDELEDGKSYICSDSRKVKPINLAKARKKLPPWYHARPASSRRRTVQQARRFPGRSVQKHEAAAAALRTPKKLLVFRNGDPTVRHTVVLHKRSSPTFDSILSYISELMLFRVVKLHTPDGRRVDGLPGLIMCSGTVVAAGREPFKSANYNAQKSPASTRLSNNRKGLRRVKSVNRKKKALSYGSKSRNFSPSSERYIVNRIHSSIAESSLDRQLPSNPTNSVDFDMRESAERMEFEDGVLPAEDDIEKSFRVNQDGSMTVEMRVRLTLKEEETVHWTTTLSRTGVANQLNLSCLPEPEVEQEICLPLDLPTPEPFIDNLDKDTSEVDRDEDPPYLSDANNCENSNEEDMKVCADVRSPTTSVYKQIREEHASVESIKSLTPDGIQEGVIGSYAYREHIENGDITEQYCMVKQSRPVPKPRRLGSVDAGNVPGKNTSAGMTEALQIESSGEEVTETVMHIYEQQICQDNFLANISAQDASALGRPESSGTGKNDRVPESWTPESHSKRIAENTTAKSHVTSSPVTNLAANSSRSTKGKRKRSSPKQKVKRRLSTPVKSKKQQKNSAEQTNKSKSFPSAKFIKRIYGNKSKPAIKPKKKQTHKESENPHVLSPLAENANETVSLEVTQPRETQTRQNNPKSLPLPDSSCSKEYVQNWLEKTLLNLTPNLEASRTETAGNEETAQEEKSTSSDPFLRNSLRSSVKQRIQCFENKLRSANTEDHTSAAEEKPLLNGQIKADESCPVKVALQKATSPHSLSEDQFPPPPSPPAEVPGPPNAEHCTMDASSVASSSLYRVSSMSSQVSVSSTSDKIASPNDRSTAKEVPLSRNPSIKKTPLLSNQSFERKMSLRKASLSKYTIGSDASSDVSTSSAPVTIVSEDANMLANGIHTEKTPLPPIKTEKSDLKSSSSFCTSASPTSTKSGKIISSVNVSLNKDPKLSDSQSTNTRTKHKEAQSPKPQVRTGKAISSPAQKRKPQSDKSSLDSTKSSHRHNFDKTPSANATPTQERRKMFNKEKLQKNLSPYSQSLDLASPPVPRRSHKSKLSRNLSSDNASEPESRTRRTKRTPSRRKPNQTLQRDELKTIDQAEQKTQQLNTNRMLENICDSINSIRQSKKTSDFSSYVASTFGSSPKVLLAFLSIMSLKEASAEALKMIYSLRDIANIEDSQKMSSHLSNLQLSTSDNLLRCWENFHELCEGGRENSQIIDNLDIPEKVKDDLAALSGDAKSISSEENLDENLVGQGREMQMQSEETNSRHDDGVSNEDEEGQSISSATKDVGSCKQTGEHSSDKEQVEGDEVEQDKDEVLSCESHSQVVEDKPPSSDYYVQMEEKPPVEKEIVSYHESPDEAIHSEQDQSEAEYPEGEVRSKESLSINEIERENVSSPDEDVTEKSENLQPLIEEVEEDLIDENKQITESLKKVNGDLINLIENRDSFTETSQLNFDSLAKQSYRFSADGDSGNDHWSCEEQVEIDPPNIAKRRIRSSTDEELSYYLKERQQDAPLSETQCQVTICEDDVEKAKPHCDKIISPSVAKRVILLEQRVAEAERRKTVPDTSAARHLSQRYITELDVENSPSESPTSQSTLCTRSAPQSSLSFSYDSSGVITTEPESNRVRSIREMFLARSVTDVQPGPRHVPSASELSLELRTDTSVSGGYQSQTSTELSEDDSGRNYITKGFVRRTIERLYGMKDVTPDEKADERPLSAPKQKKNSSIFSSFQTARCKKKSELSYFNSTNALDTLTEVTRCMAFNAQVGPEDSVPIDRGPWPVGDNTLMRKSFSEPVGINTTFTNSPPRNRTTDNTEQVNSRTQSEPDDTEKSLSRMCTYFSLPHASDSDACQDDPSPASKTSSNGDSVRDTKDDNPDDTKAKGERNGMLPNVGVTEFRMMDNKVHPLVEAPAGGEVVVVQPGKGQGVMSRRLQEPDMLDLMYNFCGEHCPIL